jgi:hypothetical protein
VRVSVLRPLRFDSIVIGFLAKSSIHLSLLPHYFVFLFHSFAVLAAHKGLKMAELVDAAAPAVPVAAEDVATAAVASLAIGDAADSKAVTAEAAAAPTSTPAETPAADVPAHRSHDPSNNQKRTDPFMFGQRFLTQEDDVFEYNAWDHVETDDAFKEYSEKQYELQRSSPVSDFDKCKTFLFCITDCNRTHLCSSLK